MIKLELRAASSRQNPVQLQGDIYAVAASLAVKLMAFICRRRSDLPALLGQLIVNLGCELLEKILFIQRRRQNPEALTLALR